MMLLWWLVAFCIFSFFLCHLQQTFLHFFQNVVWGERHVAENSTRWVCGGENKWEIEKCHSINFSSCVYGPQQRWELPSPSLIIFTICTMTGPKWENVDPLTSRKKTPDSTFKPQCGHNNWHKGWSDSRTWSVNKVHNITITRDPLFRPEPLTSQATLANWIINPKPGLFYTKQIQRNSVLSQRTVSDLLHCADFPVF